jgi:hypothetical protein
MSFDLYNRPLEIWESTRIPIPKVEAHLGVCEFIPSHSYTFPGASNVIHGLHSWLTPLQALALVVNSRLKLWHISVGRHVKCVKARLSCLTKNPLLVLWLLMWHVTHDHWVSSINIWWLVWEIPPWINLLKNERNSLNKKVVIHAFACIAIKVFDLHCLM